MTTSSLEITIRLRDGQYFADARYQPNEVTPAPTLLAEAVPTGLRPAELAAHAGTPDAYGPRLAAQLFADERLHTVWQGIRSARQDPGDSLRLWLRMAAKDPLQQLYWELLADPLTHRPIALEDQVSLARATTSVRYDDSAPLESPELRASVIVAQPADLGRWGLSEIDIDGELSRAQAALAGLSLIYGGDQPAGRATRSALRQTLHAGPHILYLVGHALPEPRGGERCLLLEHEDGSADLVSGAALVGELQQGPSGGLRLVVLAARRRAGGGYGDALSPLGPQLAELGLPAVLTFQGDLSVSAARQLLPAFFAELRRDGRIDRALAVARQCLVQAGAWWQPVLWIGSGDGQLWRSPPVYATPMAASPTSEQINRSALHQLLTQVFSDGELRNLCFALGNIDFESLRGEGKAEKARELIGYLERRGRLAELLDRCRRERPHLDWDLVVQAAPAARPEPPPAPEPPPDHYTLIVAQREGGTPWQQIAAALAELRQIWPDHPDPAGIQAWVDSRRRQSQIGAIYAQAHGPASHALLDALEGLLEQEPANPEAARAVAALIEDPDRPLDQRLRAADIAGRFSDVRLPITAEQWRISIAERNDRFGSPQGYWCFVPGGTYSLGGGPGEGDGVPVAVSGFWVGRYPVSVAQYRRFIADGGYATAEWWHPQGWAWRQSGEIGAAPWGWGDPRYARANQPVVGLGWDEASAFCRWLQAQLGISLRGHTIRLPTEAEWEAAAARGPDGTWRSYPWGDQQPTIDRAIHLTEPQHYHQARPAPVGCAIQGAAACGALDMAGNVWELVATGWGQYPAQSNRPPDPDHGDYNVWRGGAWSSTHVDLSCRSRDRSRRLSHNLEHGGFRIALVSKSYS